MLSNWSSKKRMTVARLIVSMVTPKPLNLQDGPALIQSLSVGPDQRLLEYSYP